MERQGKLKSELHHWWPRVLFEQWFDKDGGVTRLSWNGESIRSTAANFAAITNAHLIKLSHDSYWNHNFEPMFDKADSNIGDVVRWVSSLEAGPLRDDQAFSRRFTPYELPAFRKPQLAECLASLIVRSPRTRNCFRLIVEDAWSGVEGYRASKTLIAANVHQAYKRFIDALNCNGKIIILVSSGKEFIFGDGFLHNFSSPAGGPLCPRCVVPILPNVTIIFVRPISFTVHPQLMTIKMSDREVKHFNGLVQIYSKDFIFYRNQAPEISQYFSAHQHFQCQYDEDPSLELLLNEAVTFQLR